MRLSNSARLYQERREPEFRETERRPGPRHCVGLNLVLTQELKPPLPIVPVVRAETKQPPDAGSTDVWPWGTDD